MTKNEFIATINNYVGDIIERDDEIVFCAMNELTKTETIETDKGQQFVRRTKKVYCEFSYNEEKDLLQGYEETHEILGGFAFPSPTRENLIDRLKYYRFREKEWYPLV